MAKIELRQMKEGEGARTYRANLVGAVNTKQIFGDSPVLPVWLCIVDQPAAKELATRINWEVLSLVSDANGSVVRPPKYDPETQTLNLSGVEIDPIIPWG